MLGYVRVWYVRVWYVRVWYVTFVHMWIDVKGLVAGEDAAVPVELFTQREGSVQAVHPLIGMVSYGEVLQIHVLEKNNKNNYDFS